MIIFEKNNRVSTGRLSPATYPVDDFDGTVQPPVNRGMTACPGDSVSRMMPAGTYRYPEQDRMKSADLPVYFCGLYFSPFTSTTLSGSQVISFHTPETT